jgi:hypothetical protein
VLCGKELTEDMLEDTNKIQNFVTSFKGTGIIKAKTIRNHEKIQKALQCPSFLE